MASQQKERHKQEGKGVAPVKAHGQPGGQQHQRNAKAGIQQLTDEIIGGVSPGHMAGIIVSPGIAGGEHHHDAHRQKQQNQQQEIKIHTAALLLSLPNRKAGEAGAFITHGPTSPASIDYR